MLRSLRVRRPDLQTAFSYLFEKELSIFVSDWSDDQLLAAADALGEKDFHKLWELLALLRDLYRRCFYFHFHRAAREKFLLRHLGFHIKY